MGPSVAVCAASLAANERGVHLERDGPWQHDPTGPMWTQFAKSERDVDR